MWAEYVTDLAIDYFGPGGVATGLALLTGGLVESGAFGAKAMIDSAFPRDTRKKLRVRDPVRARAEDKRDLANQKRILAGKKTPKGHSTKGAVTSSMARRSSSRNVLRVRKGKRKTGRSSSRGSKRSRAFRQRKPSRKQMMVLQALLTPPRTCVYEDQAQYQILEGYYPFWCPVSFLGAPEVASMWADTGDGSAVIGSSAASENVAVLESGSFSLKFTCLSNVPVSCRVWWLVARDNWQDGTSVTNLIVDALKLGIAARQLDADTTAEGNTSGTVDFYSYMMGLSLYDSTQLTSKFRVKRGAFFRLIGGTSKMVSYRTKKPRMIEYSETQSTNQVTMRGLTVVPVFQLWTDMGFSNNAGTYDFNDVTNLVGRVSAVWTKRVTFKLVSPSRPVMAISDAKDHAFAAVGAILEGQDVDTEEGGSVAP